MKDTASQAASQLALAIRAAEDKKAENISVLQMDKSSSAFTDYFLITHGSNPRQVQAIADEIELRLKQNGVYPNSIEGYKQAEWILLDYVHYVVHVFSEASRKFYDLERLWKSAKRISAADLVSKRGSAREFADAIQTAKRRKPARSAAAKATGKAIRAATSRSKAAPKKKSAKAKPRTKAKSPAKAKTKSARSPKKK